MPAAETPNPLAADVEEAPPCSPTQSADRPADEPYGGRVNIKDVLLDAQAYRGINEMCFTLFMVFVGFNFLSSLTPQTIAKNNAQLKEWALPEKTDMVDSIKVAEFVHGWYSRLLDDSIVDGHNRALLAYLGTAGWGGMHIHRKGGSLWPDEECDLGSMAPDISGKIRGEYPSELGKTDPFTNYRLPCMRELHYNDGDNQDNGGYKSGSIGDGALHFSDPVLMGKYNFTAVMHWWNHDYPVIYLASLKKENRSQVKDAINQASSFIAQQDPLDLRMGIHLYNPQSETVADVEIQIYRAYKTSHRTVSLVVNSYNVRGRGGEFYAWAFAVFLCFLGNAFRFGRSSWRQGRYRSLYHRVRSDYLWRRWAPRGQDDAPPSQGLLCAEAASPCSNRGHLWHWGMVELLALFFQFANCVFTVGLMLAGPSVWESLPPAESAESLASHLDTWNFIFRTAKESVFPNAAYGIHSQLILIAFMNLTLVLILLRDLQWHDGIGVITRTLGFAAKDLQDIVVVTVLIIGGFASFSVALFGGLGSQDLFTSFVDSFQSLSLLGFGKNVNYDVIVNDNKGIRFDGIGMGPLAWLKPLVFWMLLFLLVFVIPNIILAVIVEGFERHIDVANQRVKVTLLEMLRRRVYLICWRLKARVNSADSGQGHLAGQPKWARQMALASSPVVQTVLDGLTNPVTGETLPIEIRDRFLISRQEEEIWDELSTDELKSRKARLREQKFFYRITTAENLQALLRFGVDVGSGHCDDEGINALSQQIWLLHSKDADGSPWAEMVAEDHGSDLGTGGNHIRSVVRNELRPVVDRLLKIEQANATTLLAVEEKLSAMQQAHNEQMATVIKMLGELK